MSRDVPADGDYEAAVLVDKINGIFYGSICGFR